MFQKLRKYTPMLLIAMMSAFAVALAIDEYNDCRRIAQDLRIESYVELETEDYEWEESDCCTQSVFGFSSELYLAERTVRFAGRRERGFISYKQRLGLVRRYAPRKALAGYNCVETLGYGINSEEFVPYFIYIYFTELNNRRS